ncbi:MAG: hypothetical protein AAGH57_14540 [Pseudomonadota bacterium]
MTQNLAIILVSILSLLIVAFAAIGIAALAFIWVPRLGGLTSSLLGSLLVPMAVTGSLLIIMAYENTTPPPADLIAVLAVTAGPCVVVGWPCAYLVVRALDRRVERAGLSAREMFE